MVARANPTPLNFDNAQFRSFLTTNNIDLYPTMGMAEFQRDIGVEAITTYRSDFIKSIVDEVVARDYAGIDLNHEGFNGDDRDIYGDFIRDLATALHNEHKKLIVTTAGKDSAYGTWGATASQDLSVIGTYADYVRVMSYGATESLPVSQVRSWIEYTISRINHEKVVLANPFFDSGPAYTSQMSDLVLEYDLHGLCAWTLSYDQSEPGDFGVIRSKFPTQ